MFVSCAILVAAILGSSYTGLKGDWLTANVVLGDEIYLASIGLTDVQLQNRGASRRFDLAQLCAQTGSDSVWCTLDAIGADTEATLTFSLVPALVTMALSLLTVLRNCCGAALRRGAPAPTDEAELGIPSAIYNGAMLLCTIAFWLMTTSGMCLYSFRAPASLGMGATTYGRSYDLLRACVLYATLGSVALLARALSLWDTQTAQMLLREAVQSRIQKQWLYWMLGVQLLLYLVVALSEFDYAAIVPLLGLNYLSSKSPQMLWAYVLLTLVTLPQDAVLLARTLGGWHDADLIVNLSRLAFVGIVALKAALLVGMGMLHTRFRFRLELFEEEEQPRVDKSQQQGRSGYDV